MSQRNNEILLTAVTQLLNDERRSVDLGPITPYDVRFAMAPWIDVPDDVRCKVKFVKAMRTLSCRNGESFEPVYRDTMGAGMKNALSYNIRDANNPMSKAMGLRDTKDICDFIADNWDYAGC